MDRVGADRPNEYARLAIVFQSERSSESHPSRQREMLAHATSDYIYSRGKHDRAIFDRSFLSCRRGL